MYWRGRTNYKNKVLILFIWKLANRILMCRPVWRKRQKRLMIVILLIIHILWATRNCDGRLPFFICASNVAQQAGIAALRQADPDVERIKLVYDERRRYMIARLREMGFEIKVEPQGAFYIFANAHKFTTDSYRFAFDVFEHAHVGITPGVDFGTGGEGYVRFSYANSLENIKEGLDRISRYLSRSGF